VTQPARFTARAQREFLEALRQVEHASAAERLRRSVEDMARWLGQHPLMGRLEPTLADARYRFCSIPGFPYLLVYRPGTSPPSIVRFVHTARDLPALLVRLRGPEPH
jgi:toxin ParE1/3/4